MVEVTQADREAANAYRDDSIARLMAGEPGGWKDTPEDYLVQAFARHRIAERERNAKCAEDIGESYGEDETGWIECSETIAQAIREQSNGA